MCSCAGSSMPAEDFVNMQAPAALHVLLGTAACAALLLPPLDCNCWPSVSNTTCQRVRARDTPVVQDECLPLHTITCWLHLQGAAAVVRQPLRMTPPAPCHQRVFPALQEATSKGLRRTRSAEGVPVGSPRRPPPKPPTPTIPEGGVLADSEKQLQEAASTEGPARHGAAEEDAAGAACAPAIILPKQGAPQAASLRGAKTTLWPAFVPNLYRRQGLVGGACFGSPVMLQRSMSAYLTSMSAAAVLALPWPSQQGHGCMQVGFSGPHKARSSHVLLPLQ